jgi:hypothetical protein
MLFIFKGCSPVTEIIFLNLKIMDPDLSVLHRSPTYLSLILIFSLLAVLTAFSQSENFTAIRTEVYFDQPIRDWDGFGFNYVETAQTVDYDSDPQEYGGFSLLDDTERQEIIEMVFGEEGLKVGLVKMFYDPWHQEEPNGPFNHEKSTRYIRMFVREGLKKTRERGADLQIITTLYGPPAWATRQKFLRGRDLDPEMKDELCNYMIDWIRFLRNEEGFPVKYMSLHNEGEDWWRWPADGSHGNIGEGHDYNLYWPPEQVVEFIKMMRDKMDEQGFGMVGITNGEPTNWFRFSTWGYADYIYRDKEALRKLGLITSHGFYNGAYTSRWFGPHTSQGIDLLRENRPMLKAWVTSTSWSNMDARNIKEMHGNIYSTKVNGIIPWAGIQRPTMWVGGDPNPGSAFTVREDGSYEVRRGYYFYKQITRAGQPGMAVARTMSMDSQVAMIAFSSNGTNNPNAFVVVNWSDWDKKVSINISGCESESFEAFQTTEDESKLYSPAGIFKVEDNTILFESPKGSVTTFFAD